MKFLSHTTQASLSTDKRRLIKINKLCGLSLYSEQPFISALEHRKSSFGTVYYSDIYTNVGLMSYKQREASETSAQEVIRFAI